MSMTPVSTTNGAQSLDTGVRREPPAMTLIAKTLEGLQSLPQPDLSGLQQTVRIDAGIGTKVDTSA